MRTTHHQVDAVVIGSGPNGLTAAITLAEQGRSVLIVEARALPGGAVATEALTLPGFLHDTFSAVHPAAVASPVFARMPLARHGLRWIHPKIAMAHPLPQGRAAALYRDVAHTAASLDALSAGDGRRWQALVSPYLKHSSALRSVLLSGFPPVGGGLRLLLALHIPGTLEFARLLLLSADALAGELFRSRGAAAWLFGSALHGDVPTSAAGSAMTAFYLNVLGHVVGWPSPEGGAGQLVRALVSYFQELGGQIWTSSAAERVLIRRQRVQGVLLANGDIVQTRIVIGNVNPHGLLKLAAGALPMRYSNSLQHYRYGAPTFKLDWALDGPIPWDAPEARQAGTVHVGGDADAMHHIQAQQQAGITPDHPFMLLGQQSLADPGRAPAGKHTAWAYTHPPPGLDWPAEQSRYIDRMEAHIEYYAPGFRDRILARHAICPPDFERRNRNLVQGDVGGGSYALDQLVFRPLPALLPYRTPIKGLYLASASTFPGGAVHGVAGQAAAQLALLEARTPRFW
jgi:phytoene dehydrogenase-like protein